MSSADALAPGKVKELAERLWCLSSSSGSTFALLILSSATGWTTKRTLLGNFATCWFWLLMKPVVWQTPSNERNGFEDSFVSEMEELLIEHSALVELSPSRRSVVVWEKLFTFVIQWILAGSTADASSTDTIKNWECLILSSRKGFIKLQQRPSQQLDRKEWQHFSWFLKGSKLSLLQETGKYKPKRKLSWRKMYNKERTILSNLATHSGRQQVVVKWIPQSTPMRTRIKALEEK